MSKAGAFVFVTGLLLTAGGAGGVENSLSDGDLLAATLIAGVGLMIMWAGTLLIQQEKAID